MNAPEPKLHSLAAALADGSRARLLCLLMDARAYTNKELASHAGITPATASAHLAKLTEAGLVASLRSGRCVYYRLADERTASLLEHMASFGTNFEGSFGTPPPAPNRQGARRCYNHLAGRLGVAVTQRLAAMEVVTITDDAVLTGQAASRFCEAFGLAIQLTPGTPARAKPCLDWTERRHHLSGPLATAMMERMLAYDWLRAPRHTRALTITPTGIAGFARVFDLACSETGPL